MGQTQTATATRMLCHACQNPARWIDDVRRPYCARHVQRAFTLPNGKAARSPRLRPIDQ